MAKETKLTQGIYGSVSDSNIFIGEEGQNNKLVTWKEVNNSQTKMSISINANIDALDDFLSGMVNIAQSTADTANATAQTAQATADTATATASVAQHTADTATATAKTAQYAAKTAQYTAETAQYTAQTAMDTANVAQDTSNVAQDTANTAVATASTAEATASVAQYTANVAQLAAIIGQDLAEEAQDVAATAMAAANTAIHAAQTAQDAANTATEVACVGELVDQIGANTASISELSTQISKISGDIQGSSVENMKYMKASVLNQYGFDYSKNENTYGDPIESDDSTESNPLWKAAGSTDVYETPSTELQEIIDGMDELIQKGIKQLNNIEDKTNQSEALSIQNRSLSDQSALLAKSAQDAADAAHNSANSATSSALEALSSANDAYDHAQDAYEHAQKAQKSADNAQTNADAALEYSKEAKGSAATAWSWASQARDDAASALINAEKAGISATSALEAASAAWENANDALTASLEAQSDAYLAGVASECAQYQAGVAIGAAADAQGYAEWVESVKAEIDGKGLWNLSTDNAELAGFTITSDAIYNGITDFGNTTPESGIYLGLKGIQLGQGFKVDNTGKVTATELNITLNDSQINDIANQVGNSSTETYYAYYLSNSSTVPTISSDSNGQQVPSGWSLDPLTTNSTNQYLYFASNTKTVKGENTTYGDWSKIGLLSKYGVNGSNGTTNGLLYIANNYSGYSVAPTVSTMNQWSTTVLDPTSSAKYVHVSSYTYDGTNYTFTTPTLYNSYDKILTVLASNDVNLITIDTSTNPYTYHLNIDEIDGAISNTVTIGGFRVVDKQYLCSDAYYNYGYGTKISTDGISFSTTVNNNTRDTAYMNSSGYIYCQNLSAAVSLTANTIDVENFIKYKSNNVLCIDTCSTTTPTAAAKYSLEWADVSSEAPYKQDNLIEVEFKDTVVTAMVCLKGSGATSADDLSGVSHILTPGAYLGTTHSAEYGVRWSGSKVYIELDIGTVVNGFIVWALCKH